MCLRSSVPCTLKAGQKDIITIKWNGRRGNMYHITASIYYSKSNSGSRRGVQFPRIISRQYCAQSVVPARIKYFFRQLMEDQIMAWSIKIIPEWVSPLGNWQYSTWGANTINDFRACLGAQLTICAQKWRNFVLFSTVSLRFVLSRVCVFLYSLGPRSLSTNLKCEPPLVVFLALKLHSKTRSKKLVELLHEFLLVVDYGYKIVLSIEASFARVIGTKAKANGDIVCSTYLRHNISSVAALGNKIIIRRPVHIMTHL